MATEEPLQRVLDEGQKETYRRMLATALRTARAYRGDEASFDAFIETANALDVWMRQTFGKGTSLGTEGETIIADNAGARKVTTIDGILDTAQTSFRRLLEQQRTTKEMLQHLRIVHVEIDGILVPPGSQGIQRGDGSGEWRETKTEPRVERLITALQEHGIFTDDLIVTIGSVRDSMMRKVSYALIEIPRIGKEVLVCDQVGEATFVSDRHYGLSTYLSKIKGDLLELPGVTKIVSRGQGKWEADVLEELFKDRHLKDERKVNVRDMDAIRREILRRIPMVSDWLAMSLDTRKKFKIEGRGEMAIATALGLKLGKNSNMYAHALLGQAVYGEGPEIKVVIEQEERWATLEKDRIELIRAVKMRCPTAEEWMAMNKDTRREFEIEGRGEAAIATALGLKLERDPTINRYEHALLGQAVYGETLEIRAAIGEGEKRITKEREENVIEKKKRWKELKKDSVKLTEAVKTQYPTAEEWMAMNRDTRKEFEIEGRREMAIATALGLGLKKDPTANTYAHALLGQAVYGEGPEIKVVIEQEGRWATLEKDRIELINAVKTRCKTLEEWMAMNRDTRRAFEIEGRGEAAIATALGLELEKDPTINRYEHALLGRAVYGGAPEINVVIEQEERWAALEKDPALLINAVKTQCPTAEEWMAMNEGTREEFKIEGRGEAAIAVALELKLEKKPTLNKYAHALLGQRIYGNDPIILQALNKGQSTSIPSP